MDIGSGNNVRLHRNRGIHVEMPKYNVRLHRNRRIHVRDSEDQRFGWTNGLDKIDEKSWRYIPELKIN